MTKILIIEDDATLNAQLTDLLVGAGYAVDQSYDGDDGLIQAAKQQHHLILLDIQLPKRDGFSLLSMLRKTSQVPLIIVTAKGAEEERIKGLTQGADDYIAKPFNTTELLLRIEALLRRSHPETTNKQDTVLSLDGLYLDGVQQSATANGAGLELTQVQFKLLWTLLLHRGEVLTKAYLYQTVLNRILGVHDRSLDMHLSRVRRKLKESGWHGERVQTVHGQGYCLT